MKVMQRPQVGEEEEDVKEYPTPAAQVLEEGERKCVGKQEREVQSWERRRQRLGSNRGSYLRPDTVSL